MELRVLVIGGPSNTGKSAVAEHLATRLGGVHVSTDKMGRHPGRPWGQVPPHVVAHYQSLSDDEILEAVLAHQRAMHPAIARLVSEYDRNSAQAVLVLEGSAIMPIETRELVSDSVRAVWLTGSSAFLRSRIEAASGYKAASADARWLVDRFIERNVRLDRLCRDGAAPFGFPVIAVDDLTVSEVADACLAAT